MITNKKNIVNKKDKKDKKNKNFLKYINSRFEELENKNKKIPKKFLKMRLETLKTIIIAMSSCGFVNIKNGTIIFSMNKDNFLEKSSIRKNTFFKAIKTLEYYLILKRKTKNLKNDCLFYFTEYEINLNLFFHLLYSEVKLLNTPAKKIIKARKKDTPKSIKSVTLYTSKNLILKREFKEPKINKIELAILETTKNKKVYSPEGLNFFKNILEYPTQVIEKILKLDVIKNKHYRFLCMDFRQFEKEINLILENHKNEIFKNKEKSKYLEVWQHIKNIKNDDDYVINYVNNKNMSHTDLLDRYFSRA